MTSDSITTVTERGQVQIPADLREQLELKPGQRLAWRVLPGGDLHVHVLREDHASRRAQWRLYVSALQGERSSDDLLAEARSGDQVTKQALGL